MISYDNFFFPVDDMEKAKQYYNGTLGLALKFDFSDMGMAAYTVGEEEPAIILKDKNKFKDLKPTLWFVVENVSDRYSELKSKGVKFLSEPFKIKTGYAAEFEDPFGNRLGITDYLEG